MRLKLHGAFRSGTNYVKALLELNYESVELVADAGGWKHAPVPALFGRGHGWLIIGVVRDPWSWLPSMWSYIHDGPGSAHITCGATWRAFLTSPITVTYGTDTPDFRFACPVDYWHAMAASLLSLGERGMVVRYEDALTEPDKTCTLVAEQMGLTRKPGPFATIDRRTRNMVDRRRQQLSDYVTDQPFDPSHIFDRRYLDRFGRRERRIVRRQLDPELADRVGY